MNYKKNLLANLISMMMLPNVNATFNFGNRPVEVIGTDSWQLKRRDKQLVIVQKVTSRMGERTSTLVYDKQ